MSVVVGYGPDGDECQPVAPKCIAQSRLAEGGQATFYARSYGPALIDPADGAYADARFVKVSPACFDRYLAFLRTRTIHAFLAADRLFREWV